MQGQVGIISQMLDAERLLETARSRLLTCSYRRRNVGRRVDNAATMMVARPSCTTSYMARCINIHAGDMPHEGSWEGTAGDAHIPLPAIQMSCQTLRRSSRR